MKIYMIPFSELYDRGIEFNSFTPSDWNEYEKLPDFVNDLMKYCEENDLVYTTYNFMLCFNLQDKETYHGDYLMFIPNEAK